MKLPTLHVLLLALPLSVGAAPPPVVLLAVASGNTTAIFASDDMRISASEISFDQEQNALVCSGAVKVTSGGRTITGNGLTVKLGVTAAKVYMLNPAGVTPGVPPHPGLLGNSPFLQTPLTYGSALFPVNWSSLPSSIGSSLHLQFLSK